MTIKLGMFTMPFHHPDRDYGALLAEDQEAIVLADRLGFSEAFVGEHFSSFSERITSPLMFFATVINRTKQIRFGTGVLNLPQSHPVTVAAHAAMFDQLCQGRFIMGIGPGGLVSDLEIFDIGQAELRPQMVIESIETVLKLWAQDPPYEIDGKFWKISLTKGIWPDFKVGYIPRPYQKPHPPIALSLITPNSSSGKTAGERGWIPVSGQFFHKRYLRGHWEKYVEGCEAVGGGPIPTSGVSRAASSSRRRTRRPRTTWPIPTTASRSTTPSSTTASRRGARRCSCSSRTSRCPTRTSRWTPSSARSSSRAAPRRVLDQLVALREETGHFGTLLMGGHDWDKPALWKRSMELLANDVMPKFSAHAAATPARV